MNSKESKTTSNGPGPRGLSKNQINRSKSSIKAKKEENSLVDTDDTNMMIKQVPSKQLLPKPKTTKYIKKQEYQSRKDEIFEDGASQESDTGSLSNQILSKIKTDIVSIFESKKREVMQKRLNLTPNLRFKNYEQMFHNMVEVNMHQTNHPIVNMTMMNDLKSDALSTRGSRVVCLTQSDYREYTIRMFDLKN